MHTYLKSGSTYTVGQWLRGRDGYDAFNPLFDVSNWAAAVTAVNMLNGGDTSQVLKPTKEH